MSAAYPEQYRTSCVLLRRAAHLVLGLKTHAWKDCVDEEFEARVATGEVPLRLFFEVMPRLCPDLREQSVMRHPVCQDASIFGSVENLSSFRSICQRCGIGPTFDVARVLKGDVGGDYSACIKHFCEAIGTKYAGSAEATSVQPRQTAFQDANAAKKTSKMATGSPEPAKIDLLELYRMQKQLAESVTRMEKSIKSMMDGMVDYFVKTHEISQAAQKIQVADVRDSCGSLDTVTYPAEAPSLVSEKITLTKKDEPSLKTGHTHSKSLSLSSTILKNEKTEDQILPSSYSVATLRRYDSSQARPQSYSSPTRLRRTQSTSSLVSLAPTEYSIDTDDGLTAETDFASPPCSNLNLASPTPSTFSVATMFCPSRTPQKIPLEVKNKCRTKIELNRQKAIYEMIHTESTFIDDIGLILDCVIPLMCNHVGENAAEVAGNLAELLHCHKRIAEIWEDASNEQGYIKNPGDLFKKSLQFLEPHVQYTQHFTSVTSVKLRRPEIIEFSRYLSTLNHTGGLGLDGHLIKPIQRVTKYRLMLREIRKSTYDDDPEINLLDELDAEYGELLNKVDAGGAQMDVASVGQKIQGFDQIKRCASSRFIREGTLTLCNHSRKAPLQMCWFLFSDLLIICKPASTRRSQQTKSRLKFHFPTTRALLFPRYKLPGSKFDFQLELLPVGTEKDYSDQGFLFSCQSEDEKRAWLHAYQTAVDYHVKEEGYNFCLLPKKESSTAKFLRPISSLVMQSEKRDEVGDFTSTSALRSLDITPETMEDNCEIIVTTTEDYAPKTKHEVGFYKNTLLRIVNSDDKQYLKVSMGSVQGLVHRNRTQERNEIAGERIGYLFDALRNKSAACWIKNWAYCLSLNDRNAMPTNGLQRRRACKNYIGILGSQGEDEFEFEVDQNEKLNCEKRHSDLDRNMALKTPRLSSTNPYQAQNLKGNTHLEISKYSKKVPGMSDWVEVSKPGFRVFYYCASKNLSTWSLPGPDGQISQKELINEPFEQDLK